MLRARLGSARYLSLWLILGVNEETSSGERASLNARESFFRVFSLEGEAKITCLLSETDQTTSCCACMQPPQLQRTQKGSSFPQPSFSGWFIQVYGLFIFMAIEFCGGAQLTRDTVRGDNRDSFLQREHIWDLLFHKLCQAPQAPMFHFY